MADSKLIEKITRRLVSSLVILIALSAAVVVVCGFLNKPISVFGVVMVFGICGGFVSIQRRLKSLTKEDLELMASSWAYIFLAPLTGGALAVILYLLFMSEMIKGDAFPMFEPGDTTSKDFSRLLEYTAKGPKDYAKLMVWSFVAGFSETFVTNIVGTFASTKPRH